MRLDKYLSERTAFSRSQIKNLISAKKVKVNGVTASKADMNITGSETVSISGEVVRQDKKLTLLMNKPKDYISATEDKTEKTVIDLLPPEYKGQGLSPVGRLDKDTTGFLLLTNDGSLLHDLTSPKKHVPKYYIASLAEPFTDKAQELIIKGIILKDGSQCKPAKAAAISNDGKEVLISICEGQNHQVKRMFAATGNRVENLKRIAMGNMILPPDLQPGEVLVLLDKDLTEVLNINDIFSALITNFMKSSS